MAKVIMSFDQRGGIKVDAEGFVGTACKDATRVFENAFIGGDRKGEDKPEYYQSGGVNSQVSDKAF